MNNLLIYTGYILISAGVLFNLIAAITLVRFPDVYTRVSSSTKCITFGTLAILFGVFVMNGFSAIGIKALLCLVFVLLTSPIESHVLLRASKKSFAKMWGNDETNGGTKELKN